MAKSSGNALHDLFVHALKDIYFAEKSIYKALPKMIKGAKSADLKKALTAHRTETEGHVKRLEQVFSSLDMKPRAVTCEAIKGILKEGEEILGDFGKTAAGDAGIIFACQAVEHYEINRYGSMHEWASELGLRDAVKLLKSTLNEEYAADKKLTMMAEAHINMAAEAA